MSSNKAEATPAGGAPLRLVDLAAILVRRGGTILGTTVLLVTFGLVFVLARPREYATSALLVPAQVDAGGASLASSLARDFPMAGLLGSRPSGSEKLVDIVLRSRRLHAAAVDLVMSSDARGRLDRGVVSEAETNVKRNDDGSLSVIVTSEEPEVAALVANSYVRAINEVARSIGGNLTRAKQDFLSSELEKARDRLVDSEQRLLAFQRGRAVPNAPDQARVTMEAAGELQKAISAKELEVAALRRQATAANPELQSAVADLEALRSQLRRLTSSDKRVNPVFLPFTESSDLQIQTARLTRDVKRDEQVFISLTAALANTQIDMNNNVPVLTTLDPAPVPTRPVPLPLLPTLMLLVVLGIMLGTALAFVRELAKTWQGESRQVLAEAWSQFRSDLGAMVPARFSRSG